jgi:hypothetical protein
MQFEAQTYKIFPTPVMKFKFPREFNNTELEYFSEEKKYAVPFKGSDMISADKFVLDNPNLIEIKNFINNCLDVYMKKIFNPHDSIDPKLWTVFKFTFYSNSQEINPDYVKPSFTLKKQEILYSVIMKKLGHKISSND